MAPTSLTIEGGPEAVQNFGPHVRYYTNHGLQCAAFQLGQIHEKTVSFDYDGQKDCDLCLQLLTTTNIDKQSHHPGLVALRTSAGTCGLCYILYESLNVASVISTIRRRADAELTRKDEDEDEEDEDDTESISILPHEDETDQIVVHSLKTTDTLEELKRFYVTWHKEGSQGFNWPGEVIGVVDMASGKQCLL